MCFENLRFETVCNLVGFTDLIDKSKSEYIPSPLILIVDVTVCDPETTSRTKTIQNFCLS